MREPARTISTHPSVAMLKNDDQFLRMNNQVFMQAIDLYAARDSGYCLNRIEEYARVKGEQLFNIIAKNTQSPADIVNRTQLESELEVLAQKAVGLHQINRKIAKYQNDFERISSLDLEEANFEQIANAYKNLGEMKSFYEGRPGADQSAFLQERIQKIDALMENAGDAYLMGTTEKERKELFGDDKFEHFEGKLNDMIEQYQSPGLSSR